MCQRVNCEACSFANGEQIRTFLPSDGYFVNPATGRRSKAGRFWCRRCYEAITSRTARQAQVPPVIVTVKPSDWAYDPETKTYRPGQSDEWDSAIPQDQGGEG